MLKIKSYLFWYCGRWNRTIEYSWGY